MHINKLIHHLIRFSPITTCLIHHTQFAKCLCLSWPSWLLWSRLGALPTNTGDYYSDVMNKETPLYSWFTERGLGLQRAVDGGHKVFSDIQQFYRLATDTQSFEYIIW